MPKPVRVHRDTYVLTNGIIVQWMLSQTVGLRSGVLTLTIVSCINDGEPCVLTEDQMRVVFTNAMSIWLETA